MDNLTKLGNLFKERDNVTGDSVNSAKLINKNPITFKLNDKFFISKEFNNLKLTETAYNKIIDINTAIDTLFIAVPTFNGKTWVIIDREVSV